MKYISILSKYVFMCAAVVFTACQDDIDLSTGIITDDYGDNYFIIDSGDMPMSRTTYNDTYNTVFDEGDTIGVFGLDENGNAYEGEKNVPYAVKVIVGTLGEDGSITPSTKRSLKPATDKEVNKNRAKYLFYYPYRNDMTLEMAKKLKHTVQSDQTKKGLYEASDLLWDIASPTDGGKHCYIQMDHVMANIIIIVDEKNYAPDKGVIINGVNITAEGIDLMKDGIGEMAGSYQANNTTNGLKMWNFNYDAGGSRQFRIALPAQTINAEKNGKNFISVQYNTGKNDSNGNAVYGNKTFNLRNDLEMKPGYNYIFRLSTKPVPIINYTDDDSWVLDVIDPETGNPIGLLCREYLNYQPRITEGEEGEPADDGKDRYFDKPTGYKINDDPTRVTINSQAWVFYRLEKDGITPDLTKGQILRFIYDVRINGNEPKVSRYYDYYENNKIFNKRLDKQGVGGHAWPKSIKKNVFVGKATSGYDASASGMFLADHGHQWTYDEEGFGRSSINFYEYHMHGGTIYWNGEKGDKDGLDHNEIIHFEMPDADDIPGFPQCPRNSKYPSVLLAHTNIERQCNFNQDVFNNGHIAFERATDGTAKNIHVSYSPLTEGKVLDANGCNVGITFPHYYIDTRMSKNGKTELTKYPIRKIGFNKFWMARALETTIFTDGTPIKCYNKRSPNKGYDLPSETDFSKKLEAGYVYPFEENYCDGTNDGFNDWDPINQYTEEQLHKMGISPIFNYGALADSRIISSSVESYTTYHIPSEKDFKELCKYLGYLPNSKLMSNRILQKNREIGMREILEARAYDQMGLGINIYTGNVSGFDLTTDGIRVLYSDATNERVGRSANFWIKTNENLLGPETMRIISFYGENTWMDNLSNGDFSKSLVNHGSRENLMSDRNVWFPIPNYSNHQHFRMLNFAPIRFYLSYNVSKFSAAVPLRAQSRNVPQRQINRNVYVEICK